MEIPGRSEGFSTVYTVSGFKDAQELLGMFQRKTTAIKDDDFIKFPRTTHLINLGGASRDDLVFSEADVKRFLSVKPDFTLTLEEKIDGANLGFRIDKSTGDIRAQNRSHYVHSKYHPQFSQLSNWIYQHQDDLRAVLGEGDHILFGEWMYAKHSIHYTKLPDLFIAFDIYDCNTRSFLSRRRFNETLQSTRIHAVPQINKPVKNSEEIKSLLAVQSAFSDAPIEGVYLRIDDEKKGCLKERAKVVRADFICGNEHWSKGILTPNIVHK